MSLRADLLSRYGTRPVPDEDSYLAKRIKQAGVGDLLVMDTYEKEEVGQKSARVCVIGQAGEKQILFASIMCDHGRMAGRTGMGAVMGSKNLKAVVVRGTKKPVIANAKAFACAKGSPPDSVTPLTNFPSGNDSMISSVVDS